MTKSEKERPYIVCCGANGRCVIYGYMTEEPQNGKPARVSRAKMIVRWEGNGLLGLARDGPRGDSRITAAVEVTGTSPVTEWVAVSEKAAKEIDSWPPLA